MKKSFRRFQKVQRRRRLNFGSYPGHPGPVIVQPQPAAPLTEPLPEPREASPTASAPAPVTFATT